MARYAKKSVTGRRRTSNRPTVPFPHKLVLNQWLLGLFNVKRFEDLAAHLHNEVLEGLDENNVHHFHHALVEILRFLARYVSDRAGSIQRIERVINQGLVTADGRNLFANRFTYLNTVGLSATQVFEETLATLFNAAGGGSLYIENLKGATGEVALRVGDNEPFGVINVGDDAKLVKLCEGYSELTGTEREFSGSLFHEINKPHSTVNLLIGSKKFTEGWNSYRVSTMGLMNVGATEGSQIIQLFGRGVRLMGYCWSLKRSGKTQLLEDVTRPRHISVLETLSIFGIRANYVSNTPSHTMQTLWNMDKPAMAIRHILFQEEDKDTYVRSMLEAVGSTGTSTTADAAPA